MKKYLTTLAITATIALSLGAIYAKPASAQSTVFTSGTSDEDTGRAGIGLNATPITSDSFTLSSATTITGIDLPIWTSIGDSQSTLDFSFTSGLDSGTNYGSGTDVTVTDGSPFENSQGYNVENDSLLTGPITLSAGTYYLNLTKGVTTNGGYVSDYWDEVTTSTSSSVGYTSGDNHGTYNFQQTPTPNTFSLIGTPVQNTSTPEPSSLLGLLIGSLGLAVCGSFFGLRRRVLILAD